ncbi:MAG: cysteine-rich KTR domain-containing protein [Butyricicoccus sp.]|nr:cysteine-rich KTR domain-containing protein [Butyricicoccus sp.]
MPVLCPICGGKTRTRICKETVLEYFPLYCPKCKQETIINAHMLKISPLERAKK